MVFVKYVFGIFGGKDSVVFVIYFKDKYLDFLVEYYICDIGKEFNEIYELIKNLEVYFGQLIVKFEVVKDSLEDIFDYFLQVYGGYLFFVMVCWCIKKLKFDFFEQYIVGDDLVIFYVGIWGDEQWEGYIFKCLNI